ncbi:MAG TPA: hypothetical protein VHP83_17930 [Aggregatilineaceae bacterium]|nr:hypothetical protein [Aggregatilineaceae bacterium]
MRIGLALAGIVLVVGIAVSAVLGWSLLVGWILTQIVDFTLFEGALLAMIASGMVLLGAISAIKSIARPAGFDADDLDFEIPPTRFYQSDEEKTWEAWMRYTFSNSIYFQFDRNLDLDMSEKEQQEMAIQIAGVAVGLLKGKASSARRYSVTPTALKQQMNKMDIKANDEQDDILESAAGSINIALEIPTVERVIRQKLWDKPSTFLDEL